MSLKFFEFRTTLYRDKIFSAIFSVFPAVPILKHLFLTGLLLGFYGIITKAFCLCQRIFSKDEKMKKDENTCPLRTFYAK